MNISSISKLRIKLSNIIVVSIVGFFLSLQLLSIKANTNPDSELKEYPAFEDLKNLPGYEVKFDYKGHLAERQIAYDYYKKQDLEHGYFNRRCAEWFEEEIQKKPIFELFKNNDVVGCSKLHIDLIGIDFYDIDDDGEKEMLIYNKGTCIKGGCDFLILKKQKKLNNIDNVEYMAFFDNCEDESIKILNTKKLGMHDILFDKFIFQWLGKSYNMTMSYEEREDFYTNY